MTNSYLCKNCSYFPIHRRLSAAPTSECFTVGAIQPLHVYLPSEFQPLLHELASASENDRAMLRYALVLMVIDDEKARVTGTRVKNRREFVAVRTIAGDEVEIGGRVISGALEGMWLEQI